MQYSAKNAIPYVSMVDAGTLELVRSTGVKVVTSADLVQKYEACWTKAQLESHLAAGRAIDAIVQGAFAYAGKSVREKSPITEYDLQQQMIRWFEEEGLVSDSAPVVAVEAHSADPHYLPSADHAAGIATDQVLLLDLWGKMAEPGAVFADITWVGFTGTRVPADAAHAFDAIVRARDAAVALVEDAATTGRELHGWEVDRAAREVLVQSGYGDRILHRTGHSLGESVHGNGVHLDDYETHDDRRILPGTGFTVEPGLYFDTFGVRTEINVFRGERDARVTGPRQMALVTLGT